MVHSTVASRTSLMGQLRESTSVVREQRDVLAGRVSWLDYRMYLLRLYGFHAAVERALIGTRALSSVVPDAKLRNHKSALLASDLVALGVDRFALIQVARMPFAGALELPEALGWTYVLESQAQSSKQLLRHLTRQLPAELASASAYLGCYGGEAPERWRELGEAIDAYAHAERDAHRVVTAACDGFLQLRSWVSPVVQPRSNRIHA